LSIRFLYEFYRCFLSAFLPLPAKLTTLISYLEKVTPYLVPKFATVSEKAFVADTNPISVPPPADGESTNGCKAESQYIAQVDSQKNGLTS